MAARDNCGKCKKTYTTKTLVKYGGICGKCNTASGKVGNAKKMKIPKKIREGCWKKHIGNMIDGKCYSCSGVISVLDFQAGHIQSEYDNGKITIDNLRPICKQCNLSCGVMNLDVFKNMLNPQMKPEKRINNYIAPAEPVKTVTNYGSRRNSQFRDRLNNGRMNNRRLNFGGSRKCTNAFCSNKSVPGGLVCQFHY